jgi:hypothetical protein
VAAERRSDSDDGVSSVAVLIHGGHPPVHLQLRITIGAHGAHGVCCRPLMAGKQGGPRDIPVNQARAQKLSDGDGGRAAVWLTRSHIEEGARGRAEDGNAENAEDDDQQHGPRTPTGRLGPLARRRDLTAGSLLGRLLTRHAESVATMRVPRKSTRPEASYPQAGIRWWQRVAASYSLATYRWVRVWGLLPMLADDRDPRPHFQPGMVDVDVQGLDDFARLLRTELDANFKPVSDRITMEHRAGVTFGSGIRSGEVAAARAAYDQCLGRAAQNLAAYVTASEILIDAASKIAKSYRDADALSAARLSAIDAALAQAVTDARSARDRVLAAQQAAYDRRRNLLEGLS